MEHTTREERKMFGYGARVKTTRGEVGMVVGRTSRTYRILLDGHGGRTNRGRHFGEGIEVGRLFAEVIKDDDTSSFSTIGCR